MRPAWRPRMSLRMLMSLVAGTAVLLGAYTTRKYGARRSYYLDRASVYATQSRAFSVQAGEAQRRASALLRAAEGGDGELTEKNRKWADDELLRVSLLERAARYSARLEQSFREAAERPWDRPPPDSADPALYSPDHETRPN